VLETIRAILDPILKPLTDLNFAEWRRRRRLRKLGTEMFVLYVRLDQTVIEGPRIINHLEQYLVCLR
jgi:hypothetical protein